MVSSPEVGSWNGGWARSIPRLDAIQGSAWPAQHGRDTRPRPDLDFGDHLEAEALVDADVLRLRRLQVRERLFAVAAGERMPHQGRAEALALPGRVDADLRQVPVRFARVRLFHLLEGGEQVVEVFPLRRVLEQLRDDLAFWLH